MTSLKPRKDDDLLTRNRVRTLTLALLAAGVGCNSAGGGEPASDNLVQPTDGSRLKVRWYEAPGGQRSFAGWYDSLLGVRCSFQRAEDGELRCLPSSAVPLGESFGDLGCTVPVVLTSSKACEQPRFIRRDASSLCQARWQIHRVGEKVESAHVYAGYPQCRAIPIETSVLHTLGEEMPVTGFVRSSRQVEPLRADEPVRLAIAEADDGSRGLADWQLDTGDPCIPLTLEDDRLHCVPATRTATTIYGDASCREGLVRVRPACESPPSFARKPSDACPMRPSALYRIGPPAPTLYSVYPQSNACEVVVATPQEEFRTVGEPVPASQHPVFAEVIEPGPHRLRRRTLVAPGGRAVVSNWFDSSRSSTCAPVWLDGRYRCVPGGTSVSDHFADDRCSRPLYAPSGACPPEYVTIPDDVEVCPPTATIYAVGPVRTDGYYFRARFGNDPTVRCVKSVAPSPRPLHELSSLPATDFVEMKLIEP